MTYPHDKYDPELHGDEEAPAANKTLAFAITLLAVAFPLAIWAWLS